MDNGLASSGDVANFADMATPQDLPRQVNQSKNDIKSLYELQAKTHRRVKRIDRQHGRQLDCLAQRLDAVDGRLDNMDGRLDHMDGRLDNMDGRLDNMDGRLDNMDGRLEAIELTHGGKLDEILGILKAP